MNNSACIQISSCSGYEIMIWTLEMEKASSSYPIIFQPSIIVRNLKLSQPQDEKNCKEKLPFFLI